MPGPRLVIAAFDGLQPSQVTRARMPVVSGLASNGVRFLHNHAVFPTVTRANSATLVTGVTPGRHGLTANKSIFPEYSSTEVVDALVPKLAEINRLTGGRLLFAPTVGELISKQGLKWVSVVGGTSGNAFVQHPNAGEFDGIVIHPEFTNPSFHHAEIVSRFGEWPAKDAPAAELVKRTAEVAIEYALGELAPDVLLVWFPEPDTSQHAFGIDSPEAQEMYSLADARLGRVLDAVKDRGDGPDVFVVSDHGYSTIDSVIDVRTELANAGFRPDGPWDSPGGDLDGEANGVIVAENGGSVLLYVPGRSQHLTDRLLKWLSAQEWVGAIATDLANPGIPGIAAISDIGLDGARAPDIAVAMRSRDTARPAPHARTGAAAGGKLGAGSHGGGSPAELHNTLIASGPSFKTGVDSSLPSGNIDIAPTVLELLGVPVPGHFDGRVLWEALRSQGLSAHALTDQPPEFQSTAGPSNRSATKPVIEKIRVGGTEYLCAFG
ncbi:MAG: alkaline phosphatase family protein [Chloroflexi bacterium]|nr:alkaline phosphatase family protein [Chloroflexota bacterium]